MKSTFETVDTHSESHHATPSRQKPLLFEKAPISRGTFSICLHLKPPLTQKLIF